MSETMTPIERIKHVHPDLYDKLSEAVYDLQIPTEGLRTESKERIIGFIQTAEETGKISTQTAEDLHNALKGVTRTSRVTQRTITGIECTQPQGKEVRFDSGKRPLYKASISVQGLPYTILFCDDTEVNALSQINTWAYDKNDVFDTHDFMVMSKLIEEKHIEIDV